MEVTAKQLIRELWKNKIVLALATVLFAILAGVYTKITIEPVYEAKKIALLKYSSANSWEAQPDYNKELSSFNLSKNLIKTYVDMGNLSVIGRETKANLGMNQQERSTISSVKVSSSEESQLLTLTAQGTDLEQLKEYLSEYSQVYKQFAAESFGVDNLLFLTDVETTGKPVNQSVSRNSLLGGLLGFTVVFTVVLGRYLMTFRTS